MSHHGIMAALVLGVASTIACNDATGPALPHGQLAYRRMADGGLYLMGADGSGRRRVWYANNDAAVCPSWSPDGSRIAFHTFYVSQIFVVTVATGQVQQLTNGPDGNQCPAWSPDGSRIAFIGISTSPSYSYSLYVMNADGTNPTLLSTGNFVADRLSWSPDGRFIAAATSSDQILLVNSETGAVQLDSTPGIAARAPYWSPDGQRIAFTGENGSPSIYVMDANGKNIHRLTNDSFIDDYPVWTLDGQEVTFYRYQYKSTPAGGSIFIASLHLVRLDGTEVPWVAGDSAQGDFPIWRPRS